MLDHLNTTVELQTNRYRPANQQIGNKTYHFSITFHTHSTLYLSHLICNTYHRVFLPTLLHQIATLLNQIHKCKNHTQFLIKVSLKNYVIKTISSSCHKEEMISMASPAFSFTCSSCIPSRHGFYVQGDLRGRRALCMPSDSWLPLQLSRLVRL